MKRYSIICCMLIFISCGAFCQLVINDALLNKSEVLKLKRGAYNASNAMHKTSFGPYAVIDIRKGKQHLVGRQHDEYFEVVGKTSGMKKSTGTIKSQPFSLTIIQEGSDTIISNVDLVTVKGGDHALIEMRNKKASDDEQETEESYCSGMLIQIRADTLNWYIPKATELNDDYKSFPSLFDMTLTNGVDKILMKGAEDFPMKRAIFGNTTKGIIFLYNKKQIAAVETYPEPTIWFSTDINERHKQVIAAAIISLLSITNSKMTKII